MSGLIILSSIAICFAGEDKNFCANRSHSGNCVGQCYNSSTGQYACAYAACVGEEKCDAGCDTNGNVYANCNQ